MEVKLLEKKEIAKDIYMFKTTKPKSYEYFSGQATLISYKNKTRPFTFTSSIKDNFLEFIIRIYDNHNGFTKDLRDLNVNDVFDISKPIGKMKYKGKGLFLAGGTGITPFISMLKDIGETGNYLIYSIKNKEDLIQNNFLVEKLEENYEVFLSEKHKRIDKEFLSNYLGYNYYYICGPIGFNNEIKEILINLGIKKDKIIE